jgi:ABC-type antimicrobial peptide transport system permease subunit
MGTLGLASVLVAAWVIPAALVGGLYYGLAGIGHAMRGERNSKETTALISDVLIAALLLAIVVVAVFQRQF